MESAAREAQAYFGRPEIYVERYLAWPRHVEMQILADTHGNTLWLGERDCSAQRRHQKLIEESPAPDFPDEVRQAMGEAAVKVSEACGYYNAGTVEFLYQDGEFYFLEMNTRLQVEHPVTELVTGLDLVAWQIRIASGEPLDFTQEDVAAQRPRHRGAHQRRGPDRRALLPLARHHQLASTRRPAPASGSTPATRRATPSASTTTTSSPSSSSGRPTARRPVAACSGPSPRRVIAGVATTIPADVAILSHPDFAGGEALDQVGRGDARPERPGGRGAGSGRARRRRRGRADRRARRHGRGRRPALLGASCGCPTSGPRQPAPAGRPAGPSAPPPLRSPAPARARSTVPMQGTIVKVLVAVGDVVEVGQTICLLEAMKMENAVAAEKDGVIKEVRVSAGDSVGAGDVVAVIE